MKKFVLPMIVICIIFTLSLHSNAGHQVTTIPYEFGNVRSNIIVDYRESHYYSLTIPDSVPQVTFTITAGNDISANFYTLNADGSLNNRFANVLAATPGKNNTYSASKQCWALPPGNYVIGIMTTNSNGATYEFQLKPFSEPVPSINNMQPYQIGTLVEKVIYGSTTHYYSFTVEDSISALYYSYSTSYPYTLMRIFDTTDFNKEALKTIIAQDDTGSDWYTSNGYDLTLSPGTYIIAISGPSLESYRLRIDIPSQKVSLTTTKKTIQIGDTVQLVTSISPASTSNKSLTFKSSNTSVATVDKNGTVKGKKAGTAKITVKTAFGQTATCTITVNPVVAKSIKLNKTSTTLRYGNAIILKETIYPSNTTNKKVTWTSSKPSVASVDSSGMVIAKAAGTTTITATISGKKATCKITVPTVTNYDRIYSEDWILTNTTNTLWSLHLDDIFYFNSNKSFYIGNVSYGLFSFSGNKLTLKYNYGFTYNETYTCTFKNGKMYWKNSAGTCTFKAFKYD